MDTLHYDIWVCLECLGATKKPVLPVHNLDIAVSYRLESELQYTDLPVYCDSPNINCPMLEGIINWQTSVTFLIFVKFLPKCIFM